MSIITNAIFSPDIVEISGRYMTVFLIITLIASLLATDTRYWNNYASNIFGTSSNPLLLIFVTIVIFKIILIL